MRRLNFRWRYVVVALAMVGALAVVTNAVAPRHAFADPPADQTQDAGPPDCKKNGDPMTWALCPIFNGAANSADWIFQNLLTPFLITEPVGTDVGDSSFQIWSTFRIYGDILLVIAVLVVVIGQSIGGGLVDAYTVKKVLPRVLLVAILINLSVYIVAFLVDITNVIGKSIGDIMTAPIRANKEWNFTPNALQGGAVFGLGLLGLILSAGGIAAVLGGLVFSGGGGGAFIKIALYAGLFIVLPIILAVIAVFATLIIRKGLILFLVLIAPVAFALYCLPNTEKYFKKWWDLLLEALMVYPIIVAIFAIADILSVTILSANSITRSQLTPGTGATIALSGGSMVAVILAFFLQFLPLLAIPWSFRIAGGTLSRLHEAVTNGGNKLNEFAQKRGEMAKRDFQIQRMQGRQNMYSRANERASREGNNRFTRSRFARAVRRGGYGFLAGRAGGYNMEGAMSAMRSQVQKEMQDQIATGDDTEIRALTVDKRTSRQRIQDGRRQYMTAGGRWVDESSVDRAQQRWRGNQMAYQESLSYEMKKATSQEQVDNLVGSYQNLARSWGLNNQQAGSLWTGAAFANQQTNLEYKHYKWNGENGLRMDGQGLLTEIDEKKGNYQMLQQSADTWTTMSQEVVRARQVLDGQVAGDRAQAQDVLQRAARVAHSMRSSSFEQTGMEGEVPIQGPRMAGGGRAAGAGAPGRVQEEINSFIQATDMNAGRYTGPTAGGPTVVNGVNRTPPPLPPTAPEESLNRRDRPGTS